jgi:hypothetical protein
MRASSRTRHFGKQVPKKHRRAGHTAAELSCTGPPPPRSVRRKRIDCDMCDTALLCSE